MAVNDPTLALPASEQVAAGNSAPVTGITRPGPRGDNQPRRDVPVDFCGRRHPERQHQRRSGRRLPKPGSLTLSAPYEDITAALDSLAHTAGAAAGADTIRFAIWDQFGVERGGSIPVSISAAGKSGVPAETWTGAVSSDWNTQGNWSRGAVPKHGDSVMIAGGTPNAPVLANATLSGERITLDNNATLTLNNVRLDSLLQASGSDSLRIGGTLTIGKHGNLGPEQAGRLFVNTSGTAVPIVNNGTIEAPQDSLLSITNGGTETGAALTITNRGTIAANGGQISFDFAPPPFGTAPRNG